MTTELTIRRPDDWHLHLRDGAMLEGVIGDSWTWSAYVQTGQTRVDLHSATPIQIRFNNALDAVRVTAELPTGGSEVRNAYVIRKATLKPTDALLAIERAEPVE